MHPRSLVHLLVFTGAAAAPGLVAQSQFRELGKSPIPREHHETTSVGVGDVNGDSDPDLVLGTFRGQTRLYLNDCRGAFTDATAGRIPAASEATQGVVLVDADRDGDLD